MMNRFFTFLLVFVSAACSAQHIVTVADNSDFTTINNGKITSVFMLDNELTSDQAASLDSWITANSSLFQISKSGLNITTVMPTDYNDRNVYTKMFRVIGVDQLKVRVGNDLQTMEIEQFFQMFGL